MHVIADIYLFLINFILSPTVRNGKLGASCGVLANFDVWITMESGILVALNM